MLVDLHMHTGYSEDAEPHTVAEKVEAYIARGYQIIGITDHMEFQHKGNPVCEDMEACLRDMRAAQQIYAQDITVLCGIEMGQMYADPRADEFLAAHAYDMVIGSVHMMPNDIDIYFHDYEKLDCDAFLHSYFDQVMRLVRHGGFDVLAHLDYPLRVMKHGDYVPSFDPYMERVSEVLQEVIDRGYALELNAAGIAGWQQKVGLPDAVMAEYKRLGGERISIGSDSHALSTVGRGIAECYAHAKAFGFDKVTYFKNRKAEQVSI